MLRSEWLATRLWAAILIAGLAAPALVFAGIHETAAGSCVWIVMDDGKGGYLQGTGWILDRAQGLIVTNEHVVGKRQEVTIYLTHWEEEKLVHDSGVYIHKIAPLTGKVLALDVKRDLALLQVPQIVEGYPELKLAQASAKVDDKLYFVGNSEATGKPMDAAQLWHFGELTVAVIGFRVHPRDTGGMTEAKTVQVKGGVRHGDSGGPVVNERGELVGVVSSVDLKDPALAFLTDVTELRRFVDRYRNGPPKIDKQQPLLGRWHLVAHIPDKEDMHAAWDIFPEGKVQWDGYSLVADGTYKQEQGDLVHLQFPSLGMNTRGQLKWDGDARFTVKFTDAEYEFLRIE